MTNATSRPSSTTRAGHASPPQPGVPVAKVMQHLSAIAQIMNTFHLRHMLRLYAAFDGDLLAAVVLGEVAHHNFAAIRNAASTAHELSALSNQRDESGLPPMLPTNAYSIATATGIPRETVRRKVDVLVGRRLLRRDGRGSLFVTPHAREHFAGFNVESVAAFIGTCREIESLLYDGADAGAIRRAPRAPGGPRAAADGAVAREKPDGRRHERR
jgi:hypothetical protein